MQQEELLIFRAADIIKEMDAGKKFKFNKLVPMHSGNPQALGQPPITFGREVLSLILHDQFGKKVDFSRYSKDAIERAKFYISNIDPPAIGAYTGRIKGYDCIAQEIVDFIKRRDGIEIDNESLYLTAGASEAIDIFIRLLIGDQKDGLMVPIPNYPLYSASITLWGGTQVPYFLDESDDWALNIESLENSYKRARDQEVKIKGIVIINPGNPTGQVLTKQNLRDVLQFAFDKQMLVLADEVYQDNIYGDYKFYSMRSVLHELGDPIRNQLELISMHSVSKGFTGEWGLRGGYFEFVNLGKFATQMIFKSKLIKFWAPTLGMIALGTMVNPPRIGFNSNKAVELYTKERNYILDGLERRAKLLHSKLNKMQGITTNPTKGALYSFAKLELPLKFIEEARILGIHPDTHFSLCLVEETGIVTVPGSIFGQEEETSHIRMTNLICDDELMNESMLRMHKMVKELHQKYW
jgi:aspartate/methionine/tyrosine aminotransferase